MALGENVAGSRVISVQPKSSILSVFSAMNYKEWYALGEFVDNSLQSAEHPVFREKLVGLHGPNYRVRIDIDVVGSGRSAEIHIRDNAAGIPESEIDRAFVAGAPPLDKTGLSQYGIGMKSAAAWFSNNFSVTSTHIGEGVRRTVNFDVRKIVESNLTEIEIDEEEVPFDTHGTLIVLRNLNAVPVGTTVWKIKDYLSSMYREFVRDSERCLITYGGEPLEYQPPAILVAPYWEKKTEPGQGAEREWYLPVEIVVDGSSQPGFSVAEGEDAPVVRGWIGILKVGSTARAGLSLVWKRKVVAGAGGTGGNTDGQYRPHAIFGSPNSKPAQRFVGELDMSEFKVTGFKDQIVWRPGQEEDLLEKLRALLEEGDEPFSRMVHNYSPRVLDSIKEVEEHLRDTIIDVVGDIGYRPTDEELEGFLRGSSATAPEMPDSRHELPAPGEFEVDGPGGQYRMRLNWVEEPGDQWLRVTHLTEENVWSINLNLAHLYMRHYLRLPGADIRPISTLACIFASAIVQLTRGGNGVPARMLHDAVEYELNRLRSYFVDGE